MEDISIRKTSGQIFQRTKWIPQERMKRRSELPPPSHTFNFTVLFLREFSYNFIK